MSSAEPVAIRTFPSDDTDFAAYVREARSQVGGDPVALQVALRRRYPAAVVRVRTDLASPQGAHPLWYVFRYGSVVPPQDRWWEGSDQARAILDSERTFLDATPSLAAIVEVPLEILRGTRVEAFANPEDPSIADDIAAVWQRFLAEGELHTTLRFNRMDGTPREIEIHLMRDREGPGRHVAVVREI